MTTATDMKLKRPKFRNYAPGEFPDDDRFDVVELKYDGWWGQLVLEGHTWEIYSRTGMLKKTGVLHTPMERTVLHGEYIYGTEWAKDHPYYYDQLAIHGAEIIAGVNVSRIENFRQRRMLKRLVNNLRSERIQAGMFLVNQHPLGIASGLWDERTDFEGLVFKNSQAPWGHEFGRMKRDATMDYVCLGFEESTSDRHAGWGVASVIGGLYSDDGWNEVCKVSGLTDDQRREFYDAPDDFIGQVFTASGKKITKKGALRHPNFVRWRDDKKPSECTWETS